MYKESWSRKDIISFCNEEVFPLVKSGSLVVKSIEAAKIVEKFRRENDFPKTMTPVISNGFLYINGKPAGRIGLMEPKVNYSHRAAYYEGRILSRCGL